MCVGAHDHVAISCYYHIMGITLIRMDLLCGFVYLWFAFKNVSPDELEKASLCRIRPRQHMFKHTDCNAVPAKQVAHWVATVGDNLRAKFASQFPQCIEIKHARRSRRNSER